MYSAKSHRDTRTLSNPLFRNEILRHGFFLDLNKELAPLKAEYIPQLDAIRIPLVNSGSTPEKDAVRQRAESTQQAVRTVAYHGTSLKGLWGIIKEGKLRGPRAFVSKVFEVAFRGYGAEANLEYQVGYERLG